MKSVLYSQLKRKVLKGKQYIYVGELDNFHIIK